MSASDSITIDAPRFWSTVMRSGEIGPGKAGGLRRLALTDADKEMRDLFVTWCTEAGCTVTVDRLGNIFARRPCSDDHLPPVLMGSHLDTQVAGGKYDGIVGVLAGLEVLRTLDDQRVRTRRSLELVCWTNEEGARFTPPMVASGASAGVFEVDWVLDLRDDDGKVFGGELERIGYARQRSAAAASTPTSSCTSSRARSSTAKPCRSASWSAATPPAACTSTSSARRPTRGRRRWTGGATRWSARRCWPSR